MPADLRKLRHLVTVAREGSLSRAAGKLHISQPALSRSITVAEEQLGVRVFERGHQGAELTSTGRVVVAEAEKLLNQSRAFEHNLALYSRGESGSVAFGIWPLIGSLVLPGLSTHFVTTRPRLKLWASTKAAGALLKNLYDEEIEIMFCGENQVSPSPDLLVKEIGEITLDVLVRNGHPLSHRKSVTETEIHAYPLLSGVDLTEIPPEFMDNGVFYSDNYEVMRHTTLNTDGIWFAPQQLAHGELEAGTIRRLTVVDGMKRPLKPTRIRIQLVCLKGYTLSPAGRDVVDYVCDFFAALS